MKIICALVWLFNLLVQSHPLDRALALTLSRSLSLFFSLLLRVMSDKDVEDVQHNLSCELLLHSAKDLPAPRTPETCQAHPTVFTAAVIDKDNFVG